MGSRKVIKMINHLGHCTSYHTTEEVEIEATFESAKQNLVIPIGMNLSPRCGTDVVWDNFDRFIDTKLQLKKHYTITLVLHTRLLKKKNQWMKNLIMTRIYPLKKKHFLQENLQRLFRGRRAIQSSSLDILSYRILCRPYIDFPPDNRPEQFGWTLSSGDKYIIKWFEGSAVSRNLDVTISEEPSTENATKGTYNAAFSLLLQ